MRQSPLLSILLITGLTFIPGRLSSEVPNRSRIFDYFVLTAPDCSYFFNHYHRV